MSKIANIAEPIIKEIDLGEKIGCLIMKTANQWIQEAKNTPIPDQLFSELWHEGELCILFASTGLGKTALAVQIADSISKGKSISGFKNKVEAQLILYFDFELTGKQFEGRASNKYKDHYQFNDNFMRIEFNAESEKTDGINEEDYLVNSIIETVEKTDAKIVFIDNITYLRSDTEKGKEALPLMRKLNEIKKKYSLSILALAHTPKRDRHKGITRNDLSGSSLLMNFCDSSFAIGASTGDANMRYIIQIKERFTEKFYGSDNIILISLEKPENCLKFSFSGFGDEYDYLRVVSQSEVKEIEQAIISLSKQGLSSRVIAKQLNITDSKAYRIIKKYDVNPFL